MAFDIVGDFRMTRDRNSGRMTRTHSSEDVPQGFTLELVRDKFFTTNCRVARVSIIAQTF